MDAKNNDTVPIVSAEETTSHGTGNNDEEAESSSTITNQIIDEPRIEIPNTYTLELPVLLLFFSWNISGTVFQNQILYQSCTNIFNYNESACALIINDFDRDNVREFKF